MSLANTNLIECVTVAYEHLRPHSQQSLSQSLLSLTEFGMNHLLHKRDHHLSKKKGHSSLTITRRDVQLLFALFLPHQKLANR